jgi:hypothetical protein
LDGARRQNSSDQPADRDNSGNWLVLVEPTTEPYGADDFN